MDFVFTAPLISFEHVEKGCHGADPGNARRALQRSPGRARLPYPQATRVAVLWTSRRAVSEGIFHPSADACWKKHDYRYATCLRVPLYPFPGIAERSPIRM